MHPPRQMVADLQRLKAGQSLRARRARRQRGRSIATGVAAIAGLALVGIILGALVQRYRSRPRLLLHDHFDAPQLDTNLWTSGHADLGKPGAPGRSFQVEQSGGELVLLAKADHQEGESVGESRWMDLDRDLRQLGPCRIEIEVAGEASRGRFVVLISDTNAQPRNIDPSGAKLVEFDAHNGDESLSWPAVCLRIDLLPACEAAVVYPDTSRLDEFDVVDLHALPVWRLRVFCSHSLPGASPEGR